MFWGRAEFEGRPRMSLKTSTNGKILYIYNAGNTIDYYDAATYKTCARSRSTETSRQAFTSCPDRRRKQRRPNIKEYVVSGFSRT